MPNLLYLTTVVILISGLACKNTKDVQAPPTEKKEVSEYPEDNKYRLVVSFFSPGNGIDHKMKQRYAEFVGTEYPQIVYEKTRWGKEGEIDFCFQLRELTENKKDQFVGASKELLSNSSRVHIHENTSCRTEKSP